MRIYKKITIIYLFILLLLSAVAFGLTGLGFSVAEEAESERLFIMEKGAYIRKSSKYEGLQFSAKISSDLLDEVKSDADKCFGGLIIPYDWFETYGVDEDGGGYYEKFSKIDSVDVTEYSKDGLVETVIGEDIYVNFTISQLYYKNIIRDYFGIIYVKTATNDGPTYEYAYFTVGDNVRNAAEVAEAGLKEDENNAKLYAQYVNKGEILKSNPNITYNDFIIAYEVLDFEKMIVSLPSGENPFDGMAVKLARSAYEALSDQAKASVKDKLSVLQTVEETYAQNYSLATDLGVDGGNIFYNTGENDSLTAENVSEGYDCNAKISTEKDDAYGTVQVITATDDLSSSTNNLAINFTAQTMTAISNALKENPDACVTFKMKSDKAFGVFFGSASVPYYDDYRNNRDGKVLTVKLSADTWTDVSISASDWALFNGIVSRDGIRESAITLYITNIVIVK